METRRASALRSKQIIETVERKGSLRANSENPKKTRKQNKQVVEAGPQFKVPSLTLCKPKLNVAKSKSQARNVPGLKIPLSPILDVSSNLNCHLGSGLKRVSHDSSPAIIYHSSPICRDSIRTVATESYCQNDRQEANVETDRRSNDEHETRGSPFKSPKATHNQIPRSRIPIKRHSLRIPLSPIGNVTKSFGRHLGRNYKRASCLPSPTGIYQSSPICEDLPQDSVYHKESLEILDSEVSCLNRSGSRKADSKVDKGELRDHKLARRLRGSKTHDAPVTPVRGEPAKRQTRSTRTLCARDSTAEPPGQAVVTTLHAACRSKTPDIPSNNLLMNSTITYARHNTAPVESALSDYSDDDSDDASDDTCYSTMELFNLQEVIAIGQELKFDNARAKLLGASSSWKALPECASDDDCASPPKKPKKPMKNAKQFEKQNCKKDDGYDRWIKKMVAEFDEIDKLQLCISE